MSFLIPIIGNAVALMVAWMFFAAGLSKLSATNTAYYVGVFSGYGIQLPELAKALIRLVAMVELLIAILLVLPATQVFGAIFAASMLSFYLVLMARQLLQGKADIDCGCAGPNTSMSISALLLCRNAALIILLLLPAMSSGAVALNFWVLSLLLGGVLVLVLQSVEQLLSNNEKLQLLKEL